jgi:hypothetical protein
LPFGVLDDPGHLDLGCLCRLGWPLAAVSVGDDGHGGYVWRGWGVASQPVDAAKPVASSAPCNQSTAANYYKGLTDILLTEKWVAKSAVYALPELSANAKGGV